MKIALLAAMDKEVALLKNILSRCEKKEFSNIAGYHGQIGRHEVFLTKCGIGKVNAALNTYKIIQGFKPDLIINSGVAGGAGGLQIGGLLVASEVAYHDVWCGPGTVPGAADGYDAILKPSPVILDIAQKTLDPATTSYGLIATGDKFISSADEIKLIKSIFPEAVAVDMESAAIGQAATGAGVDFSIIRVVSDTPGEGENVSQYKDFWNKAPVKTFSAISHILEDL